MFHPGLEHLCGRSDLSRHCPRCLAASKHIVIGLALRERIRPSPPIIDERRLCALYRGITG